MREMMKTLNKLIILMLLITSFVAGAAGYERTLLKAKLDAYDKTNNTMVINGRPYPVKIDVKKSAYNDELNSLKLVQFRDLKVDEIYYFTLYAGDKEQAKGIQNVGFIALQEPEE